MSGHDLLLQANPKAGYLTHKAELDEAVSRVLESGWYILGTEGKCFEQEFAAYHSAESALGVASGTDAVHLALRAAGIGPGDGVVTVSHTAVATVAAIEMAGAVPVLVDIDPGDFTIDLAKLDDTIKKSSVAQSIKAIVPVHLYGHPADMTSIMEISQRHGLVVVEDCA